MLIGSILILTGCGGDVDGPGTSATVQWAARREGALHIYANTSLMTPVLAAFARRYPEIELTLEDMNSTRMAAQVVAQVDGGKPVADFVWSSAMDVQIKLINDGYAQTYRSPQRSAMPAGSVWRDQGFGITAEPIVFAYNRRLLTPEDAPRSHGDLLRLLETRPEVLRGRMTIYDAERSGVALLQLSADTQIYPDAWRLVAAMGAAQPRLDTSGQRMMGQLASGRMAFVYNVSQSYGEAWVAIHPDVALMIPTDYHLSVSRVAFIPRGAAHPNAARLFLDFLLSREGQRAIAAAGVRPVRADVEPGESIATPGARPIRVGPALLANLDQERRARLLARWREAMQGAPRAPLDPSAP